MGVKISHLAADRRTITLPVGDEKLTLTYRPGALTPAVEDQLRDLIEDQRAGASLAALLSTMLVDWDLTDDDGWALPTTAETLRQLPIVWLGRVAKAITEDMRPNPPSAGTSGAGS